VEALAALGRYGEAVRHLWQKNPIKLKAKSASTSKRI
jgi:hypothetical protein